MVSVRDAGQGLRDVKVEAGPPPAANTDQTAVSTESATLVDAKIGEINGRPIRVEDLLGPLGDRLSQTARERRLQPGDWLLIQRAQPPGNREVSREDWLALVDRLIRMQLGLILQDELLAAEARASMKPEQRAGLRQFAKEMTEIKRRSLGGSRAELERQLRANKQNEQHFGKDIEAQVLVRMQLEEKVENRSRPSWRDVQRYYQRNREIFQPPAIARFRMIIVPAANTEAVQSIQAALDKGEPFTQVASLPINEWNASEGGLFGEGKTEIAGPFTSAEPFAFDSWNEAARKLTPGKFTLQPVSRVDSTGATVLTWLCLESLNERARPLSDADVQLSITQRLRDSAIDAARTTYIRRLVQRATYSDLETMTHTLVDIAADRYWPMGG